MHAPNVPNFQKNILQDRFENIRPRHTLGGGQPWKDESLNGSRRPGGHGWPGGVPETVREQHTRLRLWKLLRELDVPPPMLLHLEQELYDLLGSAYKAGPCANCQSMKNDLSNMLYTWRR